MQKAMIYIQPDGKTAMALCAACPPVFLGADEGQDANVERIPHFYSEQHARDEGWVMTTDPRYCQSQRGSAWICPECAGKGAL